MWYVKKVVAILAMSILAAPYLTAGAMDKVNLSEGNKDSIVAQEKINNQVYEILKAHDWAGLAKFYTDIYRCPDADSTVGGKINFPLAQCWSNDVFFYGYNNRLKAPLWNFHLLNEQNKEVAIPAVFFEKALYYAFTKLYMDTYHEDPAHLINTAHYLAFLKNFEGTMWQDEAEQAMIEGWQNGNRDISFSPMKDVKGGNVLRSFYTASLLGHDNPFRYIRISGLYADIRYNKKAVEELRRVVLEMETTGKAMKKMNVVDQIKAQWMEELLQLGRSENPRALQFLANPEIWKLLAVKPTQHMKQLVRDVEEKCSKKAGEKGLCASMKNQAQLHGYWLMTDKEITDGVKQQINHPRTANGAIQPHM